MMSSFVYLELPLWRNKQKNESIIWTIPINERANLLTIYSGRRCFHV